jgi:carboxypeptidase C (cathepsin A)
MRKRWMGVACLAVALAGSAVAQERERATPVTTERAPRPRLPAPAVTKQTLDLPGGALHFSATAGAIVVPDADGAPQAEIATIAYQIDGAAPATRPVTFVVNGGPGYASAWLQLGAVGPWRIRMGGPGDDHDGIPSAAPELLPNQETWLGFTDLVFIDPVGTGFSRFVATGDDVRKRLWSVNGDIDYLAEVMRRWLEAAGRVASPKYLLGESYGGLRVPRVARVLAEEQGIGVSGLLLVSPELDAGGRSSAFDPLFFAEHLPSMAAVERAKHGPVTRAALADVEAYATGDYLRDQLGNTQDPAVLQRLTDRVAALTGLDAALVRSEAGALNVYSFMRGTAPGQVASIYDGTLTEPAAVATNPYFREPETELNRLTAPFTSAMLELYAHHLGWRPDGLYRLFNQQAERQWDWGRGLLAPEAVTALRLDLAADPQLHVLVSHGLFDLVTPYLATALMLDHLPQIGPPGRVKLVTYEGGHMFYGRDAARAGLRDEARRLITGE